MIENDRLTSLLDCFFAATCSSEEKDELMLLLDSGEYDEAIKAYIDKVWEKGSVPSQLTGTQSEGILAAILSNKKTPVVPLTGSLRSKRWYWVAAAVLLITLSTTALILFVGSPGQHKNIASDTHLTVPLKNDVAPGTMGAVLTLSDGSVIVLDSASDGNVAKQGGTNIMKSGASVHYKSQPGGNDASEYNTIGTPGGRQFQLVLEDGTKVWLNAKSSIHFPTVFNKNERQVDITGEAYFEVAKNVARPFVVSVKGMKVQVLGTHFNINAYDDEPAIKTTLLEGLVKVVKDDNVKMLTPGQQAHLDQGRLSVIKNVNTTEIVAWKNDLFSFDHTDIKNLMRQIARWYNVEIVMPENISAVTFVGQISRKSNLSDVLKMLELTGEVKFSIDDKRIIVDMQNLN